MCAGGIPIRNKSNPIDVVLAGLEIQRFMKLYNKTKILCVGCWPIDIINYMKICKKDSIDPLADFYKEKFDKNNVRNNNSINV